MTERTVAEKEALQRKLFGCTAAELETSVKHYLAQPWAEGPLFYVISGLSDAQEMLAMSPGSLKGEEACRQALNRAKFVLMELQGGKKFS